MATDQHAKTRVKLYLLDAENQWIDQGTGHCSCEFNSDKSEGTLKVISEEDESKVILNSKIRIGEDVYQRQQGTLILWSEEDGTDLSLSFQDAEGCTEIWNSISEVQQHYGIVVDMEQADDLFSDPADVNGGVSSSEFITLPNPDISNLAEIERIIKNSLDSVMDKEKLAGFIGVDYILRNEIFEGVIGMLEYDPEFPEKDNFRELLAKRAKYKQVVPIRDPEIEQKIHQAFRLQFLRDTVLSRVADDSVSSMIGSLIFFHNVDIVNHIHQDRPFLQELFDIMDDPTATLERKRDVILFVQQFCALVKVTQLPNRGNLHRTLYQCGMFNIFAPSLQDTESRIRMASAEILGNVMEHDPNMLRSFIVKQSDDKAPVQLLDVIVTRFLQEEDLGIKLQLSEIIRAMLDTNTSLSENGTPAMLESVGSLDPDADKFLELFYLQYFSKFVSPLLEISEGVISFDRATSSVCESICQVLSFLVRHHSFRSKYYVLSSGIASKICLLLKNRDQHLRLAALKFFRTCIGMNDEFYHRYLIKQQVIGPIVDTFLSTNNRNNLLNSACIEFFEYIRSENIKSLVAYIVPHYMDKFKDVDYVDTFQGLIRRYEQQQDTSVTDTEAQSETNSSKRGSNFSRQGDAWSSSTVDEDEEAYFNNSDDEDEVPDQGQGGGEPGGTAATASAKLSENGSLFMETSTTADGSSAQQQSPRRKLVDYDDDDDEDEDESQRKPSASVESSFSSDSSDSSDTAPPPKKRVKTEGEDDDADREDADLDNPMAQAFELTKGKGTSANSSTAIRASSPHKAGTTGIRFRLNTPGRNGRSPSPSPSPAPRSRSISPVPTSASAATSTAATPPRTEIAFVKASDGGDGANSSGSSSSSSNSNGGLGLSEGNREGEMSEAAIALKSELATQDSKRTNDDDEEMVAAAAANKRKREESAVTPVEVDEVAHIDKALKQDEGTKDATVETAEAVIAQTDEEKEVCEVQQQQSQPQPSSPNVSHCSPGVSGSPPSQAVTPPLATASD
ncbi:Platinum sensitivity protein [Actinomortierella wolfii]|nr:Platinum sensitivity protein [Actinomortierella wolfii]